MPLQTDSESIEATVVSCTRRYADVLKHSGEVQRATIASKAMDLTTGDTVLCEHKGAAITVAEVKNRKNILMRSSGSATKKLAANLDLLLIVSAARQLFNTTFIDRIAVAAHQQSIPYILLVNKEDLGLESTRSNIAIYERIGFNIVTLSAHSGSGTEQLKEILNDSSLRVVALAGISGVGKSTIMNFLMPQAARAIGAVSKTGQGRQTTSQAYGYLYPRPDTHELMLVDLPGLQNYGLAYLSEWEVREAFTEFAARRAECQYADCRHLAEPECAVRQAVETGNIAQSRYDSYLAILDEIQRAQPY